MKVSIITSVYNESHNLPSLLDSIKNQTFKDFEFLITNDGSTDDTLEILKKYEREGLNIKVFNQPHKGLTYSLNEMTKRAEGKYIARMDAGDYSFPDRIKKQADYLDRHSDTVVVGCWTRLKYNQWPILELKYPNNSNFIRKMLLRRVNCFTHGSIMFRKEATKPMTDVFRMPCSQDFDLLLRLLSKGEFAMIEEILYEYRVSVDSISFKKYKEQNEFSKLALTYFKNGNVKRNIKNDIKRILVNSKVCNEVIAKANFYNFIGNLLLRNGFPFKAREYYWKSLIKGRKVSLLFVLLCNLGRFGSYITNYFGKKMDSGWRYKISCLSNNFGGI